MEDEFIRNILEKSTNSNDYIKLTGQEIKDEIKKQVRKFYEPYLNFDKNPKNLEDTLDKLDDYMYIKDGNDIPKSYYIRYLSKEYFYDLTLSPGGFFIDYKDNQLVLYNGKKYFKIDMDNVCVFMKLKEKDRFLILLNELE